MAGWQVTADIIWSIWNMVSTTYKISIPGENCTSCFSTTTCYRSGFLNLRRNSSSWLKLCSCFRKKLPVDLIMCLINHYRHGSWESPTFIVHQSKLLYLHANLSVIVFVADRPLWAFVLFHTHSVRSWPSWSLWQSRYFLRIKACFEAARVEATVVCCNSVCVWLSSCA